MKTNAIIRIIVWSLVLVILAGILGTVLLARYAGSRLRKDFYATETILQEHNNAFTLTPTEENSTTVQNTQSFPAEEISKLEIVWVDGDITILALPDIDVIRVQEEAVSDSRYQMQARTGGRTLKLQFAEERLMEFGFGINNGTYFSKDLTIEVPAGWICEELELDVAAADLTIHNLTIRQMDFDGASGTCDFVNCNVSDLDMDTASGDVTFQGTLNTLDFDAASASFLGELQNTPSRIDMDGMSGSLDIALPEDTGFALTMDGMSSRFTSDFHGTELRNGSHIYGDGRCRIQVDGMSVDVTIRKNNTIYTPQKETIPAINHYHSEECYGINSGCVEYAGHIHSESCYDSTSGCPTYAGHSHNASGHSGAHH